MKFPDYRQLDSVDCGPACLKIVAKYHGIDYAIDYLRSICYIDKEGVNLFSLAEAAEYIGFNTSTLKLSIDELLRHAPFPAVLLWDNNHYVVVFKIRQNYRGEITHCYLSDPRNGILKLKFRDFVKHWIVIDGNNLGIALLLTPGDKFISAADPRRIELKQSSDFKFIIGYIIKYRQYFFQLLLGILAVSLISMLFPFLTQNIVDIGISNRDITFISLILIGQLVLFISSSALDLIRRQLLLHISTRINMSIISDFMAKVMKLPIRFFESKNIGDIITRINDQKRIEYFITTSVLNTVLMFFSFIVLVFLLSYYSNLILVVFLIGTALSIGSIAFFMKKRKEIDNKMLAMIYNFTPNNFVL